MALSDANRTWVLKIVADIDDAKQSLGRIESKTSTFGKTIKGAFAAVAASQAVDAIIDFGKKAVDAASDTEQAMGGSLAVFQEYADEIDAFSKTTATSMGISREEFLRLSTVTGALLKNAGVPLDKTADLSKKLTGRAADLAATFGGPVSDSMEAISSALKGEFDPLERYGVSLKASTIEAKAQAMGLVDSAGKATTYGKAMAAVQLIMEQSKNSAGQFARESDTLAGRQAVVQAQWKDMQAELGMKLLPAVTAIAGFIANNMIPAFEKMQATIKGFWEWAGPFIEAQLRVLKGAFDIILGILSGDWSRVWDGMKNYLLGWWDSIMALFGYWINLLKALGAVIWSVLSTPFSAVGRTIRDIFTGIISWFAGVPGAIGRAISSVASYIAYPFRQAVAAVYTVWNAINGFFKSSVSYIAQLFGGIANAIAKPFQWAFSAIKTMWNNTVGGFGFSIPSWVPGVGGKSFKIPSMAMGGIVTRPTVALIGEAGPEAVVPLGQQGGFGNVTINVYALTATAEVGRKVYESLQEYERISGRAIAS